MKPLHFDQAVKNIRSRDPRFELEAYSFLSEALNNSVSQLKEEKQPNRHVSAAELLHGFKDIALKQYGPMAITLLNEWGLKQTSDIGDMVFQLIDEGMFGKQDSDALEDFSGVFDFHEVFTKPYLPKNEKSV